MLPVGPVLLTRSSSDVLISAPCALTPRLLPLLLTLAPFLPGSAWGAIATKASSLHQGPLRHPLQLTGLVGGSLLLPETLFGLSTKLQRDLWPIFGFVSNIPTMDMTSRLFLCQHVLLRGWRGEGHTIPHTCKTSVLL